VDDTRPSWQVDPCPAWCAGGHAEHDHPDDRVHRSPAVAVPVVTRRTAFDGPELRRSTQAAEFEVAVSRVDGEKETWAYVGDGPAMFIEVTTESAARLIDALGDAVIRSR
jgi:hypothetical protein